MLLDGERDRQLVLRVVRTEGHQNDELFVTLDLSEAVYTHRVGLNVGDQSRTPEFGQEQGCLTIAMQYPW
jgi:hypothetical protein